MDAPVIVAGAGPAGLTAAAELRLAGVEVVVLERLARPTGQSRGLGFTARTMEVFDQRGLLRRFADFETSDQGHFGGVPVDFGVLTGAAQAAKTIPQSTTEAVLEQWARDLGADIRRGTEITGLRDTGESVEVTVDDGGVERRLTAQWLVGCDGGRSTVRKLAGFDFPGTAATMEMFLADVRGVDLAPRMIGETLPGGMVMVGPLPGGVTRLIVCERGAQPRKRSGPPEFAEVADAWKRLTGVDISHAEPVWVSAFGDATRQVTEYRRGRVILAGDSAHIHLPAGGQGMNVSIQDSVNLGWKLGSVVRGTAGVELLDTYHSERHAVGRRLLLNTRAQGLLFLSGSEMQPLREVFGELVGYREVAAHLAGMVSGLEIRYDVGGGSHPLRGMRMPKTGLSLPDGRTTDSTALLRAGRAVLLDLADNPVLRERAAGWRTRVDVVTATATDSTPDNPLHGTTAVLVRPDGYVAWAAPGSHRDLPTALRTWFGPHL
ncbi:FAD-dependent monooxygenase [Actinokineospora diospyrosa]|uniref:Bifunctional hydroxylase/dehydrase n=1 Tax=Actinokineospora diospyrosa TaxID=103728 RepID=A0ABT1IDW2_9PSEU|nr:FAD-dependent monooxygenase [Actinokineospora diospyrosa]MCP2270822.1 bifunctional hydroxylase/dehydrase [Actinokineospora diospyrosa]